MATPKTAGIPASLIADQVDELGALEKKLLPYKADLARIEILRKAIRAHFDASPAAEAFEAKGDKFLALVGPRAMEKTIDLTALIKSIGVKAYSLFATCTLGALEKNVAPTVIAQCVSADNTGTRSLKTFERCAVAFALLAFALAGSARASTLNEYILQIDELPNISGEYSIIESGPETYPDWVASGAVAAVVYEQGAHLIQSFAFDECGVNPCVPVDSTVYVGGGAGLCDSPEPGTWLMLLSGAGLVCARRRR